MRRSVLLCLCGLAASVLATKPASACLPPPVRSATEQTGYDLEEQAGAWNEARTVYLARVAATGFLESATDALRSRPPAALQLEIVLTAERILKGQLDLIIWT